MKTESHSPFRFVSMMFAGIALSALAATADPLDLYFDSANATEWFADDAWGETPPLYDSSWIAGSNAIVNISSSMTLNLNSSTTIGNLTVTGGRPITFTGSGGAQSLTFNGGTINLGPGFHVFGDGLSFQGDFTWQSGIIWDSDSTTDILRYVGTATITGGQMDFNNPSVRLGSDSNFVIDGGTLIIRQQNTTVGSIVVNSGEFHIGRNNTTHTFTITLSSLSGTGGSIIPRYRTSDPQSLNLFILNLVQSTDTTLGSEIRGINEGARLQLTKGGSGNLSLTGDVTLARKTTVGDGGLFIDSFNAIFSDDASSIAIEVTGGVLGGIGVIEVDGDDSVVIGASGRLAAGHLGSAGATTFILGNGVLDLSAATEGPNSGWLVFDLGSDATPGISYDQIALTSGILDIGTGLSFSDFDFNLLAGFGPGKYTLFATEETIVGSLGISEGQLGDYDAALFIQGNNLVLQVIPEPAAWVLPGLVVMTFALARRRKVAQR